MRKLIVSMNITLDGFMSGPGNGLDWHLERWTEEMGEALCEQLNRTDTILMGRVTYDAMAAYWKAGWSGLGFARADLAFAGLINSHRKLVFSQTLQNTSWHNSYLLKGNIGREIRELKRQHGKDLIVYGSCAIVRKLIQLQCIDEYVLWVHPVILGSGRSLFEKGRHPLSLRLVQTNSFSSGVVQMRYERSDIVRWER